MEKQKSLAVIFYSFSSPQTLLEHAFAFSGNVFLGRMQCDIVRTVADKRWNADSIYTLKTFFSVYASMDLWRRDGVDRL